MSANMEKFNLNRFPCVALALRKRKKVLSKDGRPVTEPGVKKRASGGMALDASSFRVLQLGAHGIGSMKMHVDSFRVWATKKEPPKKQLKKMSDA